MSNEFVNSGDDVPYNVSSGDLGADGKFSPDGNVNEDGKGTTGTGKDKDDSVADTNANDKSSLIMSLLTLLLTGSKTLFLVLGMFLRLSRIFFFPAVMVS